MDVEMVPAPFALATKMIRLGQNADVLLPNCNTLQGSVGAPFRLDASSGVAALATFSPVNMLLRTNCSIASFLREIPLRSGPQQRRGD